MSQHRQFFFSLLAIAGLALLGLAIYLLRSHLTHDKPTATKEKLQVILDTDLGPWTDDIGTMALLHTYADQDRLELLAVMANNAYDGAVPVIDALNHYFNRSHIPIGITKDPEAYISLGPLGWIQWFRANSDKYPHPNYQNNSEAEDAVVLYRKLLSSAKDSSVTLLSIGYLTNLGHLMGSTGDQYSPLSGPELIQAKVKQLIIMAGHFPTGTETNLKNQTELARLALNNWPTPVTFVGFEVGTDIYCGRNLLDPITNTSLRVDSPVSRIFELYHARAGELDGCFDQAAAYVLVNGLEPFWERVSGQIEIFTNGSNGWNSEGTQSYIRQKKTASTVDIIAAIDPLQER